jgi:hypothetical protein
VRKGVLKLTPILLSGSGVEPSFDNYGGNWDEKIFHLPTSSQTKKFLFVWESQGGNFLFVPFSGKIIKTWFH